MRTLASGMPWPCAAACSSLLAIAREALDQAVDQVARPDMRDVLHDGGDIDDGVVAFQHAELEVVEIEDFHGFSLPG